MFKCKVCIEKDARISELREQVKYFRSVLNPEPKVNKYEFEADNLLNGGGTETITSVIDVEAEQKENDRIQREQDAIFSGNYTDNN